MFKIDVIAAVVGVHEWGSGVTDGEVSVVTAAPAWRKIGPYVKSYLTALVGLAAVLVDTYVKVRNTSVLLLLLFIFYFFFSTSPHI
jgi:hypothetical protein